MDLELKIADMACAACVDTITNAVKAIAPMATVTTDLTTKLVHIVSDQPEEAIKSAITNAGYTIS